MRIVEEGFNTADLTPPPAHVTPPTRSTPASPHIIMVEDSPDSPDDEDELPDLGDTDQCCVCFRQTNNTLPCRHVVCLDCVIQIRRHTQGTPRCPMCRADMTSGLAQEIPPRPQPTEWWTCPGCGAVIRDTFTRRTRHRAHCPANREPTGLEGLPDRPQTPPPPTPPRRPPRGVSTHPYFRP